MESCKYQQDLDQHDAATNSTAEIESLDNQTDLTLKLSEISNVGGSTGILEENINMAGTEKEESEGKISVSAEDKQNANVNDVPNKPKIINSCDAIVSQSKDKTKIKKELNTCENIEDYHTDSKTRTERVCVAKSLENCCNNEKNSVLNMEEQEKVSSDESAIAKHHLELPSILYDKIKDIPEVLRFIHHLQNYIEKQRRKIKKLKSKIKKRAKHKDVFTQTKAINTEENEKPEVRQKTLSEEITEAAQQAVQETGFVYEETSGLYYDYNTGYYYNAEYGLYYEAKTGTYMTYNPETQTYEFHSQVDVPAAPSAPKRECKSKSAKIKRKNKLETEQATKRVRRTPPSDEEPALDMEEGECSDVSNKDSVYEISDDSASSAEEESDDVSNNWPPCMRVIVEESTIPALKSGSLHIITYEGGTIGREGKHDILVPDINISKHHLKITFEKETSRFLATDLGSRNGTMLNGKRMSSSKQESDPLEVVHGSRIQLGSITLLCHIHSGNQTCGHCEPGLIQKPEEKKEVARYNKSKEHKKELLKLKRKFAVNKFSEKEKKMNSAYNDRAQERRDTVGSQNHNEKTEVASLNKNISSENKGFKMLSKMGWAEGQTLGKEGSKGLLEPIPLVSNLGTSGLGAGGVTENVESYPTKANMGVVDTTKIDKYKRMVMKITQERFEKANTAPAFESESD